MDLQYVLLRGVQDERPEVVDTYDTLADAEQAKMLLESAMGGPGPLTPSYWIRKSYKSSQEVSGPPQDPALTHLQTLSTKLDLILDRLDKLEESLDELAERTHDLATYTYRS